MVKPDVPMTTSCGGGGEAEEMEVVRVLGTRDVALRDGRVEKFVAMCEDSLEGVE